MGVASFDRVRWGVGGREWEVGSGREGECKYSSTLCELMEDNNRTDQVSI